MTSRVFEFTLWLAADDRDLLDHTNSLHKAGADHCSADEHCGEPYAAFHREAMSFEEAARSAIRHAHAPGCHVIRCELDEHHLATSAEGSSFKMDDSFPSCHADVGQLSKLSR